MRVSIYEKYGDMWNRLYEGTKDNITWLINESVHLDEYNVTIYGLDMKTEYYRRFKKLDMDEEYLLNEQGCNIDLCGYPHEEEEILDPMDTIREYQERRTALNAEIDKVLAEL